MSEEPRQNYGRGLVDRKLVKPPSNFFAGHPKAALLVRLVRLAGGHLNGKQLFTWLSLVVSLMASSVLSVFPLDVLDEIWDLIESVSEGFLTYSSVLVLW